MKKIYVANIEEYNNIKKILLGIYVNLTKYKKYRLKKNASCFIIQNVFLYVKDTGVHKLHKFVICDDNIFEMERQARIIHYQCHIGYNKLEEQCRLYFLKKNCEIVRKVVQDCEVCKFSLPLKTSDSATI
ncbi:hypothetical protein DMUE_4353 [Dictyocoela muelleri]|nr:hypothetical protein DMUE_4353 [Dictyocoela muelleri]